MDTGFFRSRQFVIALVVALLLVAVGVAAYSAPALRSGTATGRTSGCIVELPAGTPLAADADEGGASLRGSQYTRVVTFTVDPAGLAGGVVRACTEVGALRVVPSADGLARVVATARGTDRVLVEEAAAEVRFLRTSAGLGVAAWHGPQPTAAGWWGEDGVSVGFEIHLPDTGAWDVQARTDVGALSAAGIQTSRLEARTDVGKIEVEDLRARGDVQLRTDVGKVTLGLVSVESGAVDVHTDVGAVELRLPRRADVGYHVVAVTDVGAVSVDIGPTETTTRSRDPPGSTVEARSEGYDAKPTQVRVTVRTDVGAVTVEARDVEGSS